MIDMTVACNNIHEDMSREPAVFMIQPNVVNTLGKVHQQTREGIYSGEKKVPCMIEMPCEARWKILLPS